MAPLAPDHAEPAEDRPAARKSPGNPRGRPAASDATDRRGAILDAAETLFAQRGYAATSVREVADAAGVTPAMVHYYFGNKRLLLRAVLESALEPMAVAIAAMKAAPRSTPADIARPMLGLFRRHPQLPALLAREVLLPGGTMQQHFLQFLAPRLGGSVPDLLAREQTQGRVRSSLDPRIGALMLLSLCAFPWIARELAGPGLGVGYDEAGLAALEDHIVELLERGISS